MIDEKHIRDWRIGNDAGKGFPVGESDMTPEQAAESEGYEILSTDCDGQTLCRDVNNLNDLILIRDHNGPWAVRIS
jgi:hypothetical protein